MLFPGHQRHSTGATRSDRCAAPGRLHAAAAARAAAAPHPPDLAPPARPLDAPLLMPPPPPSPRPPRRSPPSSPALRCATATPTRSSARWPSPSRAPPGPTPTRCPSWSCSPCWVSSLQPSLEPGACQELGAESACSDGIAVCCAWSAPGGIAGPCWCCYCHGCAAVLQPLLVQQTCIVAARCRNAAAGIFQPPHPAGAPSSARLCLHHSQPAALSRPWPAAGGWDKQSTVGQHSGSLLTQRIAVDELADSFTAFNTNYHDTGLFGVYAVTDRDRCSDLTWCAAPAGPGRARRAAAAARQQLPAAACRHDRRATQPAPPAAAGPWPGGQAQHAGPCEPGRGAAAAKLRLMGPPAPLPGAGSS
jgi:hypothetical protein